MYSELGFLFVKGGELSLTGEFVKQNSQLSRWDVFLALAIMDLLAYACLLLLVLCLNCGAYDDVIKNLELLF